jgi:hypothetical protein
MYRVLLLLLPAVLIILSTTQSVAEDPPAAPDPIHHGLIQKKVGFYAVYLPPDYNAEANKEKAGRCASSCTAAGLRKPATARCPAPSAVTA